MLVVAHNSSLRLLVSLFVQEDPRLHVVDGADTGDDALDLAAALGPVIILDHGIVDAAAADLAAAAPTTMILLLTPPFHASPVRSIAIDAVLSKDDLRALPATIARMLELEPLADD